MFLLERIFFVSLSPSGTLQKLLHKAGGLRFHITDACCYFMEAVKGIDFMTANRTRLPATATCSDNYHNRKLTKDRVIWLVIMNHKDIGLLRQERDREREGRKKQKLVEK